MALSLAIRKGIRDSEPKKVEHLEKIKVRERHFNETTIFKQFSIYFFRFSSLSHMCVPPYLGRLFLILRLFACRTPPVLTSPLRSISALSWLKYVFSIFVWKNSNLLFLLSGRARLRRAFLLWLCLPPPAVAPHYPGITFSYQSFF
eukprot:TRINITY_DN6438_c0_g1_i1.p1 TRINITY_DN6438_c0_g1~~TRINITY_DN6438_c0_g1_i1.p1  ORF type:complete len:161 (-),score=14.35 TRINITY_DN6438_c0_g1_i1:131-568(-)